MPIVKDVIINETGQPVTIYIEVDEQKLATGLEVEPPLNADDPYSDTRSISGQARTAFRSAMELIHVCAEQIARSVQQVPTQLQPRSCEVQFAVKIDAEVGALIAKSSTEAQIQVTLKWGQDEQ